jgi:hypothetical protein
MAQKGFTFNYDATQDYYTGCVVIDPTDGLRYECIADMTAGTIAPHDDTTNTYWQIFKSGLDADQIPAANKRDIITTSGTYTAPVSGWYKITVRGGGGGGGGAFNNGSERDGGGGGGEGGTTIAYEYMNASDTATVVIGAGGTAGAINISSGSSMIAGKGGDSSVTVNSNTYTGGCGFGGWCYLPYGGEGGTGTIKGAAGGSLGRSGGYAQVGATGGGAGGGCFYIDFNSNTIIGVDGVNGGGGGGGDASTGTTYAGTAGGNGFAWFEYFDVSLNP